MILQHLQRTCWRLVDVDVARRENSGHGSAVVARFQVARQGGAHLRRIVPAGNVTEDVDVGCAGAGDVKER